MPNGEKFWQFKNISTEEAELRISGEIIDDNWAWIYEWFGITATSPNAFRNELANYKGKQIRVWIDSPGGSVFAGAGMYNSLKEHDGKVIVVVEQAMSAASVVAMAGDEIQISPVGIMMIHNPIGYMDWGEAKDFRHAADVLDVVKETIVNAYQLRTGKDRAVIAQLMDAETYFSAQKAVSEGFADSVLYSDTAIDFSTIDNSFMVSRLAIQNSMNTTTKKIIEIAQLQAEVEKPLLVEDKKQNEEGITVEVKNVDDLRKVYPEFVNQLETDARAQGEKDERERIQGIEAIARNIDPELVAKAKYQEPVDAKDLAFQALQADGNLGKNYLNDALKDNNASGVDKVKPQAQVPGESQEPQSVTDRFKNIAAGLDARRRGISQ